jgi:ribosomal protein S18 acetylase RimI-like enzyme
MALAASISLISATTDVEWRDAKGLIQELIDWDVRQCENLGFERADVVRTFYPDGLGDIRRYSAAPGGRFLIASAQGSPAGCAGYRPLDATTCELYSVYVRANCRGRFINALLVRQLKSMAIAAGYRAMYLE